MEPSPEQLGNAEVRPLSACTKYLWSGPSFFCKCGHDIGSHSRNDHPAHGHCMWPGCSCVYFDSYRHISQEVQP